MPESTRTDYDLIVIGGGINGVGIARDAQGRGLRVMLVEQDDLGRHTSSASSKMIHGGLRYLEYYEFRLVRKALQEREVLLRAAPHIIWPQRFVVPHDRSMRPSFLIRIGLFLYDHLAKRELLPGSQGVRLDRHPAGQLLRVNSGKAFVYSDACVDDARLVVLNALDAHERGAVVRTRTRCIGAKRSDDCWQVRLQDRRSGTESSVSARALVNAAGPWVGSLLTQQLRVPAAHRLRLIKGSHIIVRKLFDHPYIYVLQNPDRRITFVIPYERDFTLIGTTDVDYQGDPADVAISADEIRYLCTELNRHFNKTIGPADVVRAYAGVRPLLDDAAADAASVTRDYWLELDTQGAPVLSVFGGKITTYRRLAEEALAKLLPVLGQQARDWTAGVPLPGGDIAHADFDRFLADVGARYPWLPEALRYRLARAYGTRLDRVLRKARSVHELGPEVAPGLYEAELIYLRDVEWACDADDVLWRRSKLGLHLPQAHSAVSAWWARVEANTLLADSL
ncbi:MAG: glycerol-3-phosphate dehydrogenase [Gammaproteobacteria bacterium]|nr:glycerol-3-phosphate dehydrogenase [Gammaproteobacteria bacterium]